MSREEAIKELTELLPEEFLSEYSEALDMAIKALEQQSTDAVDRQVVLEQTYLWSKDEFLRVTNPFDYLRKRINSLPSVTPQPKMGRWSFTKHYGRDYYVCSVCGMERMDDHSSGWNYCPNCGAKMQEVQNEISG